MLLLHWWPIFAQENGFTEPNLKYCSHQQHLAVLCHGWSLALLSFWFPLMLALEGAGHMPDIPFPFYGSEGPCVGPDSPDIQEIFFPFFEWNPIPRALIPAIRSSKYWGAQTQFQWGAFAPGRRIISQSFYALPQALHHCHRKIPVHWAES